MKTDSKICPECAEQNLYTRTVYSSGGYGPSLLRGLGNLLYTPKFSVVVCADCGLTRFYAEPRAVAKLPQAQDWRRV